MRIFLLLGLIITSICALIGSASLAVGSCDSKAAPNEFQRKALFHFEKHQWALRQLIADIHLKRLREQLLSSKKAISLPLSSYKLGTDNFNYDLLLMGEIHEWKKGTKMAEAAADIVRRFPPKWVAMEMFYTSQQKQLDIYIDAPLSSREFELAKQNLYDELERRWGHFYKEGVDSYPAFTQQAMHWIRILEACKEKKIKVYGLDIPGFEDHMGTAGAQAILSIGLRNEYWASHLAAEGRGIIYGGRGHFDTQVNPFDVSDNPFYLQDFVSDRQKDRMSLLVLEHVHR